MRMVNIHEAKTHFSKLIDGVTHGHEVMIAMAGKPVARLCPIGQKKKKRFGALKEKIKIASDFDAPLPNDVLDSFEE
jgi:prevent-host-death family protein